MSDIQLFKIIGNTVTELPGQSIAVEKSLQALMEKNLHAFLGVRFLASEYSTGKKHGGRIDTLGLDENHCPVIIEYKRSLNENVINQGLYYLDWLMDHIAEYKLLVLEKFGKEESEKIEWNSPRLLCIAGDFTKYDQYAVQQINRNIELLRYRKFGDELLMIELVNATSAQGSQAMSVDNDKSNKFQYKTVSDNLAQAKPALLDVYESLSTFLLSLGDDVQQKTLKFYIAFKRLKNFACAEIYNQSEKVLVFVKIDPQSVDLEANKGFLRDVRNVGHFGTGELEITIKSMEDLERAKPYLLQSYEAS